MEFRFVRVDVFTDRVFRGNGLAVFPEADQFPEQLMQAMATEMNLSETTFVLPPTDTSNTAKLRIFTPGSELPFAGHPTIGTAYVLATEGRTASAEFTLEENIGLIPIRIEGSVGNPGTIWMQQPLPQLGEPISDRSGITARLSVAESDLLDVPIRIASAGVPFVFIGLKTPEAVDRVSLTDRDLSEIGQGESQGVFVYAPIADAHAHEVRTRMLGSHGLGIVEDPATGGASGPLGAVLVESGVFPRAGEVEIVSRQGYRMGRPSDIFIRLSYESNELRQVQVGGRVVPVMEGVARLPD